MDIKDICKVIDRLERRRTKLNNEISEKKSELAKLCTHLETKEEEDFISGSYYDRDEYIKKKTCKTCGKLLSKVSSFGGYG